MPLSRRQQQAGPRRTSPWSLREEYAIPTSRPAILSSVWSGRGSGIDLTPNGRFSLVPLAGGVDSGAEGYFDAAI
jgi:hypothetical protein